MDFAEGQTATNPQTGQKVVYRNGAWRNAAADDNGNTDKIVQALIDGRMAFPSDSRALNKPYWQNLLSKVSERDPSFDTIDYKARARTRQDFTSGRSAQNITSFNTLLHHIGTLQKAADELDNYGGLATPLNRPANAILESSGSARPTNFRQAKLAVVGEAVRAFRGVGGARGDIEEAADAIPENGSPEQIRGSIKTLASLLEGRIKSLGEQYSAGMGKTSNGINLLDADAQKTLSDLGIGQPKGGDQASGMPGAAAGGSGTPPTPPGTPPDRGTVMFNDEMPEVRAGAQRLTPQQETYISGVAQKGGTPDQIIEAHKLFGMDLARDRAEAIYKAYQDPANRNKPLPFDYSKNEAIEQVDPGDGSAGAFFRGVTSNVPFSREIAAGITSLADGDMTYNQALEKEQGYRAFGEQKHGTAYTLGSLAGAIPLGGAEVLGARAAARAAGVAAVRGGATGAEARAIANRVFATRTAAEAAGYSGVYSLGNADGSAAERIGEGATGAIVGGALGYGAARVGGRFMQAMNARTSSALRRGPTEGQLFGEAAERRGIDYLPADVPGRTGVQMASGVANVSLGGIPMSEAAARTVASAKRGKDVVADAIGQVGDSTQAGQALQRGAKAFVDSSERRGARLYESVPVENDRRALLSNTRDALAEITQGMKSNPELSRLWTENPRLKATLDALTVKTDPVMDTSMAGVGGGKGTQVATNIEGGQLSWGDLKRFRTIVGEIVGRPSLMDDGAQIASMRKLYGALSQDMRATAQATSPAAAKAFERANSFWRGRQDRIGSVLSAVLGDDLAKSPDAAFRAVETMTSQRSGDPVKLARLIRSMPEDEANSVRATILDRLGLSSAGRQDATQEAYSPAEFMTHWSKLSDRAKSVLFQGEHRQAVDDLVRIAEGMKGSSKFANHSKTSLGTNALATLGTFWLNPLTAILSVGGQLGAGKLLSSSRVAKWLARAPKKPNIQAQRAHINALTGIARSEPAVANEVIALQQRLVDAFGGSPARLAADERRDRTTVADRQNSQDQSANQGLQP